MGPTFSLIDLRLSRDNRRGGAVLSVLAAATLWGTIGPSYDLIGEQGEADPIGIVTIRALAASCLFALWLLVKRRQALAIRLRDIPLFVIFGLVTVTAFYPVLIYSFQETGVATGVLLLYLAPVLVTMTAAVFLGEPLTRRKLGAIVLSLSGLALVVGAYRPDHLAASPLGIGLGVASAICYGAYSVIGKPLLARYPPVTVLAYHLLVGTLGLMLVRYLVADDGWPSIGSIAVIAGYNGVFTTLLPIALYTFGLSRLPAGEASLLTMWEPVVALLLATTLLGETLEPPRLAGALLILGSVVLLSVPHRARAEPTRVPI